MTRKRAPSRRPSERLEVVVEHVPAPDAEERLRQAFGLMLRAAARAEPEVPLDDGSAQDSGAETEQAHDNYRQ